MAAREKKGYGVEADKARRFAASVLDRLDVQDADARTTARLLVRSDLRGVHTHGLKFLPVYARRIMAGGCNPRPQIRIVSRGSWGAVLDGDAGLGQIGGMRALTKARETADARGMGFGACRNTSHAGALAPYLLEACGGRVIVGFANTGPSMAPPGGNFRAIGNNILGFAAPVRGAAPLCLDMTTSTLSWGKVRDRIERGASLPEGVALLPDGFWAADPTAALEHAVAAPLGGGKGFGLALMIDVLAAGLTGGTFSPGLKLLHRELSGPEETCAAFLVFRLDKMPGGRSLPDRLAEWRRSIKHGRKMPGIHDLFLPGERSATREAENRRRGFPMSPALRKELNELASELKLRQRI